MALLKELINSPRFDTDKSIGFMNNYEEIFHPYIDKEVKMLELGINKGGSLLLWREYFPEGTICGLDLEPVELDQTDRVHVYQGSQGDRDLLTSIARERAPEGFDIIIDDCSHAGGLTEISFWHLFDNHLKPGGIYVIEDWGTGYWSSWVDGKKYKPKRRLLDKSLRSLFVWLSRVFSRGGTFSRIGLKLFKVSSFRQRFPSHDYGMVGFIKTLIDECGMNDITRPGRGIPKQRSSKIKDMRIRHGQVFLIKA